MERMFVLICGKYQKVPKFPISKALSLPVWTLQSCPHSIYNLPCKLFSTDL